MALAAVAAYELNDIVERFRMKDMERAREIQLRLIDANAAVTTRFGIPGLKAALDLTGMYGGPVRSPLFALEKGKHEELKQILEKAELLPMKDHDIRNSA